MSTAIVAYSGMWAQQSAAVRARMRQSYPQSGVDIRRGISKEGQTGEHVLANAAALLVHQGL
jgi:hypothetical protein